MKAASPLRSRAFRGPSRSRTAKGIRSKAEEPFLFSGKYRQEKTDCHTSVRTASQ
jgi:hypothetical protein